MNKILFNAILFLTIFNAALAQSDAEYFSQGMKAYDNKDYVEAVNFF